MIIARINLNEKKLEIGLKFISQILEVDDKDSIYKVLWKELLLIFCEVLVEYGMPDASDFEDRLISINFRW
jgi:hypothetical protein